MDFSYFAYDERVRRSAMRDGEKKNSWKARRTKITWYTVRTKFLLQNFLRATSN